MKILVVIPTQEEMGPFLRECGRQGFQAGDGVVGRLPVVLFRGLDITVARGGLGKTRFAVQTQHLVDVCPEWDLVICAGGAGALTDELAVGDVVVGTETVEHDIKNRFGKPLLPRFRGAGLAIEGLRHLSPSALPFEVHFGPIASGDEDVVDPDRRRELLARTGALAVAWEGAGGARACSFSDVPFVEIRGVTDHADRAAASDFKANLETAMGRVATLIVTWVHGSGPRERAGGPDVLEEEENGPERSG